MSAPVCSESKVMSKGKGKVKGKALKHTTIIV